MFVTYDEYTELGYKAVSDEDFERYETMAAQTVNLYTQNRVTVDSLDEINKRGVCEIIDLMMESTQTGGRTVSGFSNSRYSESYSAEQSKSVDTRVVDAISLYFTTDQTWRGI